MFTALLRFLLVMMIGWVVAGAAFAQDDGEGEPLFVVSGDDPVVEYGLSGVWDSKWINPGAMIYHDGQFHMFRNGFRSWPGYVDIGYTVSDDGYEWTPVGDEPVFSTDEVPYAGRLAMSSSMHVEDDGTWVMYFYTWDRPTAPIGGGAIGRATASAPTGPWIPDEAPVLEAGAVGEWDAAQVGVPIVLKTDESYVMYYSGFGLNGAMRIGMATSDDGIAWTKYNDPETTDPLFASSDPVLVPGGEGEWDEFGAERPRVVQTPDGWVMVYRTQGQQGNLPTALGLATSEDGIHWQKYADNPIVTPDSMRGGNSLWFFSLLHQDDTYYLYVEALTRYSFGNSFIFLLTHEGSIFE